MSNPDKFNWEILKKELDEMAEKQKEEPTKYQEANTKLTPNVADILKKMTSNDSSEYRSLLDFHRESEERTKNERIELQKLISEMEFKYEEAKEIHAGYADAKYPEFCILPESKYYLFLRYYYIYLYSRPEPYIYRFCGSIVIPGPVEKVTFVFKP